MMVEVVQFYERADGCWMELKMDVEAMSAFIERGVNAMLRDAVEQVDDWRDAEQAIKEARDE